MLTCRLFARAVAGVLQYRGTVEDGQRVLWSGPWRMSRARAMADADRVARDIDLRQRRGQAVVQGKIGHVWRVQGERRL